MLRPVLASSAPRNQRKPFGRLPPLDAVSDLNERSLELQNCEWDGGVMAALEGCGAMDSNLGLGFKESPFMEPQAHAPQPPNPMLTPTLTLSPVALLPSSQPHPIHITVPLPYANQTQSPEEVERLIKDRTESFVRETGAGITMARASPLKLIGSADGSKFRAAAKPSPSLPVLREVKGVSSVSTRAGKAALARAPPRERHGTRYVEMSDDESHDEGLLLSPQQLDDVFRGLGNDTLSGL